MKRSQLSSPRGRPSSANERLLSLKKLNLFKISDARRHGVSQSTLSRLVAADEIIRLGAGYYCHPDSKLPSEERDFAVACARFGPRSAIGGMSALFHYGLIEQVPQRVWLVVPHDSKISSPLYRPIRTQTDLRKGVDVHAHFRMTNLERTLVEAFRYSTKVGLRIALRATRTALKEKKTTLQKIMKQAEALGLKNHIHKHWESIIPEGEAA